ncbi:MAG: PIN domain-containing protein [Actinomycetota bacterium]|nr:PIN domain-containing protein [Actinomycetota bacterium]
MTLVIDTSVVLGLYDDKDPFHARAVAFYDELDEDVFATPMIAAELDHMVRQRAGKAIVEQLWSNFDTGAIQIRWWSSAMTEILAIARARPRLGLADASLIALAPVVRTTRIATFDRRHFSAARTSDGASFTLLP